MARSTYMADTAASKSSEELSNVWDNVLSAEAQSQTKAEAATAVINPTSPSESEEIQHNHSVPVTFTSAVSSD